MQRKVLVIMLLILSLVQSATAAQLTLEEAQSLALEHNLKFQLAQSKLRGGETKYEGAKAGIYPQIGLSSSYTRTKEQPMIYSPGKIYRLQLNLQQPLYPGVGLGQLPLLAESQLASLRFEKNRAQQELKEQVASAYYNALSAQELVAVTQEAIEVAQLQLEKAKAFFEAGVVLKTDVLRAELAVGNLKQNLLAAENGVRLAWASLEATVGVCLDGFELVPPGLPQTFLSVEPDQALAFALENRPELAMAKEGVRQAELAVELARGGRRPQVALVGNYGWQGSELEFDDADWSVTLSAQLPLFDAGAQNSKIREAQEGALTAKLVQKQLEQGIALEIQAAVGGLFEAKGRLPLAQQAVEQAEAALRIAQARYSEGIGLLTEVLEAQAAHSKAKADWIGALYNYYSAVEKLELAAGAEIPESWEAR